MLVWPWMDNALTSINPKEVTHKGLFFLFMRDYLITKNIEKNLNTYE